ncbi:MAG: UDP-N-acetylmuramoyl-L-alanine--D-glutamate ligase [Candidatus Aquicultor sp.]
MEFLENNILVIGLGRSGKAASLKLKSLGITVLASDTSEKDEMKQGAAELEKSGITVRLGKQEESLLDGIDLIIVSPGVPSRVPILEAARRRGIPIWSEIELAYRLTGKPIVAITGTNGKTTTTALTGKVFEAAGQKPAVAGNIGTPLVTAVDDVDVETLVVEVSSFQLDTISDFRPKVSVLLNITEDHLDWHPDFTEYVRAKSRLFVNQTADDIAILNMDDELVRSLAPQIKAKVVGTSKKHELHPGVFLRNGRVVADIDGEVDICGVDEVKIRGDHNLDNIMAVVGIALVCGIEPILIKEVVAGFPGLSHRTEFIASVDGVDYYNDSKATNVDATVKALTAFNKPIVLLVGGRNKGNSFTALAQNIDINRQVKAVIGFGEAGQEILSALPAGTLQEYAGTVDDAVVRAAMLAQPGDIILFSPACASFDAFNGYAQRGEAFRQAVLALGEKHGESKTKQKTKQ